MPAVDLRLVLFHKASEFGDATVQGISSHRYTTVFLPPLSLLMFPPYP